MRVIVAGVLEFPPETVHESLLAARAHIEGAYTEKGCVHYAWTEDPLNPGRELQVSSKPMSTSFASTSKNPSMTKRALRVRISLLSNSQRAAGPNRSPRTDRRDFRQRSARN